MNAPYFTLPYTNGNGHFKLSDARGKIIVLTFWVSWCPDCGQDLPKKEALFQSLDRNKVQMITINVPGRERTENAGLEFAEKFLTQPTLIDNGREVYDLYSCTGVPTTVIINEQGEWVKSFNDQASFLSIVEEIGTWLEEEH
ncbi:TlpA family protein disulfide reductase [Radiobacillus kanasensis]|uniref:TlpA family protein disulfide reductase n=1 Tax=Radiobacillus kanasensis TaxID=2844358 RepID=UPI001E3EFB1E|nr:TlpA disulfide reductase family protein [Radiobacillus kanasensis]UFT98253.1 TlpA family protein disulfide reductase [Radiobacillus kanasensis]